MPHRRPKDTFRISPRQAKWILTFRLRGRSYGEKTGFPKDAPARTGNPQQEGYIGTLPSHLIMYIFIATAPQDGDVVLRLKAENPFGLIDEKFPLRNLAMNKEDFAP